MTRDELHQHMNNEVYETCSDIERSIDNNALRLAMVLTRMRNCIRNASDKDDMIMSMHDYIEMAEDIAVLMHSDGNSRQRIDISARCAAIVEPAMAAINTYAASLSAVTKKCDMMERAIKARDLEIKLLQTNVRGANDARKTALDQLSELTSRTSVHPEVRDQVLSMTGGRCYYCDVELVRCAVDLQQNDLRRVLHVDHLVPKSVGGPDHVCNYVPACGPCNTSKGDKPYVEFVRDRHPRLKLVVSQ